MDDFRKIRERKDNAPASGRQSALSCRGAALSASVAHFSGRVSVEACEDMESSLADDPSSQKGSSLPASQDSSSNSGPCSDLIDQYLTRPLTNLDKAKADRLLTKVIGIYEGSVICIAVVSL